jgi:predicted DsbA family dithiol-disulfide isomerase
MAESKQQAEGAVGVTYYTDPGCSWAWGTEPKLRKLVWEFGERLAWRYVMGGLVGDMAIYAPGLSGEGSGAAMAAYWHNVATQTGMPAPASLSRTYRSTNPACLAVKAAEQQGQEIALRVLRRLRESIFVLGQPTDDRDGILDAVRGVPRLDESRLAQNLDGPRAEEAYRSDWEETRNPNEFAMTLDDDSRPGAGKARFTEGRWRYVFPTLVFRGPAGERTVPGWHPYEAYLEAIEAVAPGVTPTKSGPRPTPRGLVVQYATAATKEIEVVCAMTRDAALEAMRALEEKGIVVAWPVGDEVLWMLPEEARAKGMD